MSRYKDADLLEKRIWELRRQYQLMDDTQTADVIMHGIYRVEQALDDIPTADVVPVKHGHWIWNEDEWNHQCSVCKERFDYSKTYELFDHGFQMASYCPCCGAKMDGGEDG